MTQSTFRAEGRRQRATLQVVKARRWELCEAFHLIDRACRGPISLEAKAEARSALASGNPEAMYVWVLLGSVASTEGDVRRLLRLSELAREAVVESERTRRARQVTAIRVIQAAPPK